MENPPATAAVILFAGLCSAASLAMAANQDCVTCHPAEAKLHERTGMAHAMIPALVSSFGRNLPDQPLHETANGYEFHFTRTLSGIGITAQRGSDKAEGVIEWVLGAGAQGQTPLVYTDRYRLESRISYFPQLRQYGITIGQEGGSSPNAPAALGRRQSSRDLESCIGCHATAITKDLEPVVPGVQCQRCHAGSDEHAKGNGKPMNPGKFTALEQVRLCGNCHRIKPPLDDTQVENVRFQPLRLVKSRCFESGKLACTTCHAAHQDAKRGDPDFYNSKCKACHAEQAGQRAHVDARQSGDCIGCHMPYVQLHPALNFTDHYIRVIKPNDHPGAILRERPGAARSSRTSN